MGTASTQLCCAPGHQTQKGRPGLVSFETGASYHSLLTQPALYRPHTPLLPATVSTFVGQATGKSGHLGPLTQEQAKGFSQAPDWKKGTQTGGGGAPSRPGPLHATPAGPARAGEYAHRPSTLG